MEIKNKWKLTAIILIGIFVLASLGFGVRYYAKQSYVEGYANGIIFVTKTQTDQGILMYLDSNENITLENIQSIELNKLCLSAVNQDE